MAPTPEASERITRLVFQIVGQVIQALKDDDDQEGLEALPPVLLTTGVIALCQSLTPDTVIEVLDGLRLCVERGDFTHIKLTQS